MFSILVLKARGHIYFLGSNLGTDVVMLARQLCRVGTNGLVIEVLEAITVTTQLKKLLLYLFLVYSFIINLYTVPTDVS